MVVLALLIVFAASAALGGRLDVAWGIAFVAFAWLCLYAVWSFCRLLADLLRDRGNP